MQYLIKFNTLIELSLSGNKIGEEGVRVLEQGNFDNLIILDLSKYTLTKTTIL